MSGNNSGHGKEQLRSNAKLQRGLTLPDSAKPVVVAAVSDEEKRAALDVNAPAVVDEDIAPADAQILRTDGRTWKDKNPRVICYFQARLPEPLKEKLATVARLTPRTGKKAVSEHSILLEELERGLDRRLRALGYKP